MQIPEIFLSWGFWYAVGGAVVALAAALLVTIVLVARGIEREARRALAAAREIEEHTRAIPGLAGALTAVESIHRRALGVVGSTARLAGLLAGAAGGGPGGAGGRTGESGSP